MTKNFNQTTILSDEEKQWILEQRLTRLTDGKEVLIYPMGSERFLSAVLQKHQQKKFSIRHFVSAILFKVSKKRYNINQAIINRSILLLPGYANIGFIFANAGAKSVTVYDQDPVTIAWLKAFKKYYDYRQYDKQKSYPSIGQLYAALTAWYPPLLLLPRHRFRTLMAWVLNPQGLRQYYLYYMVSLVKDAIKLAVTDAVEFKKPCQFYCGNIDTLINDPHHEKFDCIYVPYLLGVKNGIENENTIKHFITKLATAYPTAKILITPSRKIKEFYLLGKQYLVTNNITSIDDIVTQQYPIITEDKHWMRNQGLLIIDSSDKKLPADLAKEP